MHHYSVQQSGRILRYALVNGGAVALPSLRIRPAALRRQSADWYFSAATTLTMVLAGNSTISCGVMPVSPRQL